MDKQIVVLDFDGTICDLQVDWKALKEKFFAAFETELGKEKKGLMESILLLRKQRPELSGTIIEMVRAFEMKDGEIRYENINRNLLDEHTEFYIISNNLRETIEQFLKRENLEKNCRGIIALNPDLMPKPDPHAFLKLTELTGITNPSDYLYIGDADSDAVFAKKVGMKFKNVNQPN